MNNKDNVIAMVFTTMDYSKFKKLARNRELKQSRLQKLIASFSVKQILCPIIVNKRYEIIDGQGRYEACKVLGLPIYYVIDSNADIDDCMRMNHYNTAWTVVDFAKSFAEAGNSNYHRLLAVCEETKVPLMRALRLSNHTNGKNGDIIQKGELKFSTQDMALVRSVIEFSNQLKTALMIGNRVAETFYTGVAVMMQSKGFDQTKMLRNAEKERSSFVIMSRLEDMLREFSRVYNRGTKKDGRLYFEDYMRNKGSNVRSYDDSYLTKDKADVSTLKRRTKPGRLT